MSKDLSNGVESGPSLGTGGGVNMSEREGVLARAPLIYALSVIRFAPILKLPKLIPDIQHTIRQSLPGFFQMVKGVPPGVMHNGEPNSWAFLNRDADYACVLAMDHMILQSTNYLHFDNHLALFRECLAALTGQAGELDITGRARTPEVQGWGRNCIGCAGRRSSTGGGGCSLSRSTSARGRELTAPQPASPVCSL